ncbi:mitochondrial glycerol dehydrogenase Gld1 [Paecilomyces lecythidis]
MFGLPLLVDHHEIEKVAERLSKETGSIVTGAQVILAWSQIGGHSVIPKSVTPSRIRENFKEVSLDSEDVAAIHAIGKVPRRFNIPYVANKPRWPIDIFGEPEEKEAPHRVMM